MTQQQMTDEIEMLEAELAEVQRLERYIVERKKLLLADILDLRKFRRAGRAQADLGIIQADGKILAHLCGPYGREPGGGMLAEDIGATLY